MANTDKLIDDVKAALKAAGFGNIATRASDPGTLISAENGTAGASFYLTPQTGSKAASAPVADGGRDPALGKADALFVPEVPNAKEMIAADAVTAAKWLGISVDTARSLVKPAVR